MGQLGKTGMPYLFLARGVGVMVVKANDLFHDILLANVSFG